MPTKPTLRSFWQETRMLIAEWLVGVALSVAPTGHPEATRLAQFVQAYMKGSLERQRERLRL